MDKMKIVELKKTNLYKKMVSEENIYLSIYSIDAYIFNEELLNEEDKGLLISLKDKFDFEIINSTVKKVKKRINALIVDENNYINAKIYFNPKKYDENKVHFRPLHTAVIIDQIALVSILNMFIYEFSVSEEKLVLSNISRLIPSNFYGNRVSLKPEELFQPWKKQYKEYTQRANDLFKSNHATKEYKYEVELDLENFFPSVNPHMLFNYIYSLMPVTFKGNECELLKILLIKLLVCKVENLSEETYALYYGMQCEEVIQDYFCVGIAQGLPQSYFLGNICMIEISKIFEEVFHGKSLFYVDDSVIFTNNIEDEKDFSDKLDIINTSIKEKLEKKYLDVGDDYFRMYNESMINFICNIDFKIKVHNVGGKSTYSSIAEATKGEIYLKCLSREVSQTGFDLFTSYSDEEDRTLTNKLKALLDAIESERNIIEKQSGENINSKEKYKSKLIRYDKFFKYRKLKLELKEDCRKIGLSDIYISTDEQDFNEKFLEKYKYDIWGASVSLIIENIESTQEINELKNYLMNVNTKIYGCNNTESSYIYKSFEWFIENKNKIISPYNKYQSLGRITERHYRKYKNVHASLIRKYVKENIKNYNWHTLLRECEFFTERDLKMLSIVDANTGELKRMVLNAIYSQLFSVETNDNLVIMRKIKRNLNYGELRQLSFLRSGWFSENLFLNLDLDEETSLLKIDYSIMEVLDAFAIFVKHPTLVDNLILIHQYTSDVWKNGSKYLYFYTLHNQEHAVDLIKNIIKLIKTIDYFQISTNDYYILFIACYLHDISMVKIPANDSFLLNIIEGDEIGINFIKDLDKIDYKNIHETKRLMILFYKKIDAFFENEIRKNHARDSANEIRTRSDLKFLDSCLREMIADIALAHGQRVEDVYNIRSDAQNKLVSVKYNKILLRLADLLDMSSYRISKPILNHNIEQMNEISAFHWISHLLTKGYNLETEYNLINFEEPLIPTSIQEKIILNINVCISQFTKIDNKIKCQYGALNTDSLSASGFQIECGKRCTNEECNFICKWFVKKNEYLIEELSALKAYLKRTSGNFYETDIIIHLSIVDKTKLDTSQFDIIKNII